MRKILKSKWVSLLGATIILSLLFFVGNYWENRIGIPDQKEDMFVIGSGFYGDRKIAIIQYDLDVNKIISQHEVAIDHEFSSRVSRVQFDPETGDVFYVSMSGANPMQTGECLKYTSDKRCIPARIYKDNVFNEGNDILVYEPENDDFFNWTYNQKTKKIYTSEYNNQADWYYEINPDTLSKKLISKITLPKGKFQTGDLSIDNNHIISMYGYDEQSIIEVNYINLSDVGGEIPPVTIKNSSHNEGYISPDLKKVAFSLWPTKDGFVVYDLLSGSKKKEILSEIDTRLTNVLPVWAGNRQLIFLVKEKSGIEKLQSANLNSTKLETLVRNDNSLNIVTTSPSGRYAIVESYENESQKPIAKYSYFDFQNKVFIPMNEFSEGIRMNNSKRIFPVYFGWDVKKS